MRRLARPKQPSFRRRLPAGRAEGRTDPAVPTTWIRWKTQHANRPWFVRVPLAIEWGLEWFYYRLRALALFDLLELAGRCTVLVIAVFWLLEADDRTKERHYRAWELINSARGSPGDGGRKDALQDLNRDGVNLTAAPLEKAYLPGVDLESADLWRANLEGADLTEANLGGALLAAANLKGAWLYEVNLKGAELTVANLERAYLPRVDFEGAILRGANLEGAILRGANLEGAILRGANLKDADLRGANLEGANLEQTNLGGANLEDVKNLTQKQVNTAIGDDTTKLPWDRTRPAHWLKTADGDPPGARQ